MSYLLNLLKRERDFLLNQQIDLDLLRNLSVFFIEVIFNPAVVRLFFL